MREILIGVLASMFFAVTFILNRSMELSGGSWIWSSSLRFLFMVPFLLLIVLFRRNLKVVLKEMAKHPFQWIGWSFIGFVLFYAPITYAAAYGPGWLVAATWQLTIVAGTLLAPLFFENINTQNGVIKIRKKIPFTALGISLIILFGVVLIQYNKALDITATQLLVGVLPVVLAAFAYPLGNRKMMEVCGGRLDTFQRVFGMTLATVPFWIILSIYGFIKVGAPSTDQITQSLIVAICSGIIATTLFFIATDRVREHQGKLASVEATQSTQVLFVIVGEVLLLSSPLPTGIEIVGIIVITLGMLLHSFYSKSVSVKPKKLPVYPKQKFEG
ncbi:multidrug resistance efflux transporter family protein [Bacillus sp. 31A1R]|uniref:Multidrug resistance efflux transporter family protein n=1 Tax=Robertmurraya mangrovi TaxID=3098077 RepID=A0ABU5ISV6_9BACI|nr:multidrug resistance efflux transporter family protein [Bacillus sp. 31A1R]MDZ5470229.1 multidrug resistance efflux transporter family protein [Bacillus sp. 31A1R]